MSKKTLIVDDTKNIRLLMTKCMELEGWEVTTAANGKEGLAAIRSHSFDLIFLDIKLPEMSGTEVLRRMRGAGIQTPVIAITAYPTIKNALECTRLGVVSYLQKPFTADRLKTVLKDFLDLARVREDAPARKQEAERAIAEGDLARARNILSISLGETPEDGSLYQLLSKVYAAMGDTENACKFERAAGIFME